jgi:hypothetical protein
LVERKERERERERERSEGFFLARGGQWGFFR